MVEVVQGKGQLRPLHPRGEAAADRVHGVELVLGGHGPGPGRRLAVLQPQLRVLAEHVGRGQRRVRGRGHGGRQSGAFIVGDHVEEQLVYLTKILTNIYSILFLECDLCPDHRYHAGSSHGRHPNDLVKVVLDDEDENARHEEGGHCQGVVNQPMKKIPSEEIESILIDISLPPKCFFRTFCFCGFQRLAKC